MLITVVVLLCVPVLANAENSVVVESKIVEPGETGVTIGVYLTNDVSLVSLVIPLEFRSVIGGAFYSDNFSLKIQGRGAGFPVDGFPTWLYYGEKSGDCDGSPGYAGPSGTPGATGFYTSPDATLWVGIGITPLKLDPGTDGTPGSGTPSLLYTFDVSDQLGTFEIDSTCAAPESHLVFAPTFDPGGEVIVPEFTKGVVTVGNPCSQFAWTDINCDGMQDVMDMVLMADVTFRGVPDPGPCCVRGL